MKCKICFITGLLGLLALTSSYAGGERPSKKQTFTEFKGKYKRISYRCDAIGETPEWYSEYLIRIPGIQSVILFRKHNRGMSRARYLTWQGMSPSYESTFLLLDDGAGYREERKSDNKNEHFEFFITKINDKEYELKEMFKVKFLDGSSDDQYYECRGRFKRTRRY